MSKRKIMLLAASLVMVAILGIGGTLAYFTDADKDVNVMYTGNVKIVQNETQRDGSAYVDEQTLAPAVYFDENGEAYTPATIPEGPKGGTDATVTGPDGKALGIYDANINNEIDKIVSVTNNGTLAAYVRTLILIENDKENKICGQLHTLWCNSDGQYAEWVIDAPGDLVEYEGTTYAVAVCTYETPVAAGATSAPSLVQVWLDPKTTNDWYDLVGTDGLSIIALSQAVQAQGFDGANGTKVGAADALDLAFGEITIENVEQWLADTNVKTTGVNNVVGG